MSRTAAELVSNHDYFRGTDIVRGRAAEAEARDQYTRSSTSIAKAIGDALNISPAKIDHAVRGTTGGLGTNAMRGLSWVYDRTLNKEAAAKTPSAQEVFGVPTDVPFVGRLARTFAQQEPTAYTRYVDDYYEMFDHAMTVSNSLSINRDAANKDRIASLMRREGVWVMAAAAVRAQNESVNKINSAIRMIENASPEKYSKDEKREKINALLVKRSEVCRDAYRNMMNVVNNPKYQKQAEEAAKKIERGQ